MEVEFQTDSPRRLLPRGLGFDMPRACVRVRVSRVAPACLRHETLCGVAPCVARQVSRTLSESFDFAVITFMVEVLFFEQPLEVRAADGTINREPLPGGPVRRQPGGTAMKGGSSRFLWGRLSRFAFARFRLPLCL